MLSSGVDLIVLEDIHAKLWLSEKYLMIGSPNLTKMNLGFRKARDFWRVNTETLYFTSNPEIISQAKTEFETVFLTGVSAITSISETSSKLSQAKIVLDTFGLRSRVKARLVLSRVKTKFQIKARRDLVKIAKVATSLARSFEATYVEEIHVVMSSILFFLQQRRRDLRDLQEELRNLTEEEIISKAIEKLTETGYCALSDGELMISLEKVVN